MGKVIKFPLTSTAAEAQDSADKKLLGDHQFSSNQVIKLDPLKNVIPSFSTFRLYVNKGDIVAAAEVLSFLFGITQYQGLEASRHFVSKLSQDQYVLSIIEKLQTAVLQSKANECMMLLSSYFGLSGPNAVSIWQHLKTQDFSHLL
ncbi:MAG: hypothetical protein AB8G05_08730 [Oligoflexales bacterium]